MKEKNPFNLDVVSVRLVKDAPIMSGHPITNPEDAVLLLGKHLCEMDREVLCVINMKTDGTPINCHFASIGCLNESMAQLDYDVTDSPPPKGCKDYNEWLVKAKAERIPELDKIIR